MKYFLIAAILISAFLGSQAHAQFKCSAVLADQEEALKAVDLEDLFKNKAEVIQTGQTNEAVKAFSEIVIEAYIGNTQVGAFFKNIPAFVNHPNLRTVSTMITYIEHSYQNLLRKYITAVINGAVVENEDGVAVAEPETIQQVTAILTQEQTAHELRAKEYESILNELEAIPSDEVDEADSVNFLLTVLGSLDWPVLNYL